MVTIADVAKQAGVSMMTVSRVINKSAHVSDKTRQRVMQAVEELSYRPNMVARSLATRRNQMIAYVVSNLANPFFADVSMGVENVCVERGYIVIIYDVTSEQRMDACLNMLIDRRLDGVIFHHLDIRPEHVEQLRQNGVHCVTIDNEQDIPEITQIDSDDYEGGRMAARHLIERGHREIGCIHGCFDSEAVQNYPDLEYIERFQRKIWRNRTQGFLDEMHSAGLEPTYMLEGRGTAHRGFRAGSELYREMHDRGVAPKALYCENDVIALGVLSECLELGMRVPEEIAIVGHDGLDIGKQLYPRITSVHQPRYEMGSVAAEKLLDDIQTEAAPERILVHSQLFRGDTA